jgi:hypothetical protein
MEFKPKLNLSRCALDVQAKGLIVGSDMTVNGSRYFYVQDNRSLGEAGISEAIESSYGVTVTKVRPLIAAREYAVTCTAAEQ